LINVTDYQNLFAVNQAPRLVSTLDRRGVIAPIGVQPQAPEGTGLFAGELYAE
jgi:hypothetical protein